MYESRCAVRLWAYGPRIPGFHLGYSLPALTLPAFSPVADVDMHCGRCTGVKQRTEPV